MQNLDIKIELWKKRLLDLGKRNRLINFREIKRTNILISSPNYDELFNSLVDEEKSLKFSYPLKTVFDENGEEQSTSIIKGDLETVKTLNEQQKTLKSLRAKAKTSMEEQGINTLYLTFGMLKWRESDNPDLIISSPIILVPVNLTIDSINDPYVLNLHDDEIVMNPSLSYKFENDFRIKLPGFDEHEDNIKDYLAKVIKIAKQNDWQVTEEVHLSLLSFLKINMYKDLEQNKEKLFCNPIIKSLTGNYKDVIQVPKELNNFDHDRNIRPIDTYQVVDADSSQQDAILLSKKGISFVLQGPPGTGKSQTITNIIAEAIADGKKVLFVSEKMAALEVVKKRLTEAQLDDFCLTLHSHKANKKEVLSQLEKTFNMPATNIREDILYNLTEIEEMRKKLNEYQEQLHTKCMPLNISIYEINGRIAKLEKTDDVVFSIDDIENIDADQLNKCQYLINEYAKIVGKMIKDYSNNPWYGCNIPFLTHELRHDIEVVLTRLLKNFKRFSYIYQEIITVTGADFNNSIENIKILTEILNVSIKSPQIPDEWLKCNIDELVILANKYFFTCKKYYELKEQLRKRYGESVFDISSADIISIMEKEMEDVKDYINPERYRSNKEIILNADFITKECKELKSLLKIAFDDSEIVCQILGIKKPENINLLLSLNDLVLCIVEKPKPTYKWFNKVQSNDVLILLEDAKQHQLNLNNRMSLIKQNYDEKIIEVKYDELLYNFNENYKETLKIIADYNNLNNIRLVNKQIIFDFEINQISKLKHCKTVLDLAVKSSAIIADLLDIKQIKTVDELISLSKLISAINQNPQPTIAWFDSSKDAIIDKIIYDIRIKQNQKLKLTEIIFSKYNKDILCIDYKGILARFNTEYSSLLKKIKGGYKADKKNILTYSKEQNNKILDTEIVELLSNISELKDNEEWLKKQYSIAKELLGELYVDSFTNWEVVEKNRKNFNSIKNYFPNFQIPDSLKQILIECNFKDIKEEYSNLKETNLIGIYNTLNEVMSRNIGNYDNLEILTTLDSTLKHTIEIKKHYDLIIDYQLNKNKILEIEEIINLLNEIRNINILKKWFAEKKYLLENYLGKNYIGEKTDFNVIDNSIDVVKRIVKLLDNNVPEPLISFLVNGDYSQDKFDECQKNIKKLVELKVSERLYSILNEKNSKIVDANSMLETIDIIINSVTLTNDKYDKFTYLCKDRLPFETIMSDIIALNKVQKTEQIFLGNEKDLQNKFSFYYVGIKSDWQSIINNLNFAKEFNKISNEYSLSQKYINAVCGDKKTPEIAKKHLHNLIDAQNTIDEDLKWFFQLFDNMDELYALNIYNVYDKIENCLNLALLEEWIDFIIIRKQCREIGLTDFIEKVEQLNLQADNILNTFLKRFYKLWLDVIMPRFPSVLNFRSRTQQAIIDDFNNLDKMQFEIARLRIRERLIKKLPETNITTSSLDEVGILKRELSKQRKIMPLRRLFKAIPNLLTILKPCLMMSPLSVSLYLQADGYDFDTIIFDEASQICTEDAIGAIMRGKQIIIAGDRYQLPPTTFFNTTYSDFDGEDEDYFDDTNAYDSILDEATNAIPERTLKWHYRSRYENLIAFSNGLIYKNELTTFPSNVENIPDIGVEYVYVENGVYARGGRKSNAKEAIRVAELVFEHFDKYPNRSLGVVTFSEAQQQAIESAIRQKRLANTNYENYFAEDKEGEFFIKNLENVQGDERDTIIFSIGYAKDANGVMYMNFGPLSRNGGYRRLNVAITRAKFNVKLVGSILPMDINLDKTNSEGVKMLRQYIEFAIDGPSYFENELQLNNSKVESSFEEAIYDFLTENGYIVHTQVGCSGYRIDMAVKHPIIKGMFVLGIECDGIAYHNARTARERDRLRQSVLEDIGWTIYRIWSTDWIKDAKTEGEKLLKAVREAISNSNTNGFEIEIENDTSDFIEYEEKDDLISIEAACTKKIEEQEYEEDKYNPYNFDIYEEVDINSYDVEYVMTSSDDKYITNIIQDVIKNETPIHFDLLCKRVAILFGNQKATVKVRNNVECILEYELKSTITMKDEFCYHNDAKEIKVRIPERDSTGRSINYICTEEIAQAMFVIMDKNNGINKYDLYSVTSHEFGFNRTGTNITQAMVKACEYLLEIGKIKEYDGKIFL